MTEIDQQITELYERAEQLRQAEAWENIVTVCHQVLELDPNSTQALQFLGNWHLGRDEYGDAAKYLMLYNDLVPNQEQMILGI